MSDEVTLASNDPEPPVGTEVKDSFGRAWRRVHTVQGDATHWIQPSDGDTDPESWTKIAGNYGPVTVVLP